jgi:NAD(P)H-flavin reductase
MKIKKVMCVPTPWLFFTLQMCIQRRVKKSVNMHITYSMKEEEIFVRKRNQVFFLEDVLASCSSFFSYIQPSVL